MKIYIARIAFAAVASLPTVKAALAVPEVIPGTRTGHRVRIPFLHPRIHAVTAISAAVACGLPVVLFRLLP
jgi:hypothetical protein